MFGICGLVGLIWWPGIIHILGFGLLWILGFGFGVGFGFGLVRRFCVYCFVGMFGGRSGVLVAVCLGVAFEIGGWVGLMVGGFG